MFNMKLLIMLDMAMTPIAPIAAMPPADDRYEYQEKKVPADTIILVPEDLFNDEKEYKEWDDAIKTARPCDPLKDESYLQKE